MLGLSDEQNVIALAWDKVEQKTCLPEHLRDFFDRAGPIPVQYGCRRAYQRFYIRGKAIVRHKETFLGVYTVDASRQGLCFLSPIQMFPKERCRIRLPKTKEFQIQIVRCRRVDEGCYECGAMFVLGASTPAE
ncbi:MAG: PilZ domain-containing protein [Planctomycetes bacterium]|nr:PilZ domain-containing protein [Planctomycetota bacterium]